MFTKVVVLKLAFEFELIFMDYYCLFSLTCFLPCLIQCKVFAFGILFWELLFAHIIVVACA